MSIASQKGKPRMISGALEETQTHSSRRSVEDTVSGEQPATLSSLISLATVHTFEAKSLVVNPLLGHNAV